MARDWGRTGPITAGAVAASGLAKRWVQGGRVGSPWKALGRFVGNFCRSTTPDWDVASSVETMSQLAGRPIERLRMEPRICLPSEP